MVPNASINQCDVIIYLIMLNFASGARNTLKLIEQFVALNDFIRNLCVYVYTCTCACAHVCVCLHVLV
jgi:hypothetical protein